MENRRWKIQAGISLIEILIVVSIFAILGVIVTRSVILTLQGSKKSEGTVSVRENLDYSMSIIERQIRNAGSIDCTNSTLTNLVYKDGGGKTSTFSCSGINTADSYISSGSGRLTNSDISVTECKFLCNVGTPSDQAYIDVTLKAQSATLTGAQNSAVTTSTRIYLRAY